MFPVSFQVCEFALRLSSVAVPGGAVSMVTRKQVLATWVQIKRLLQQPVSQTKEIGVEVPTTHRPSLLVIGQWFILL